MMEKLAKFVTRYGKILLAIGIFLTLVFIPVAIGSSGDFDDQFTNQDPESIEAQKIIDAYFDKPLWDFYKTPLVVFEYRSEEGYDQLYHGGDSGDVPIYDFLLDYFLSDIDGEWALKIDLLDSFVPVLSSESETSGVLVLSITYNKDYSNDFIIKDVSNLRKTLNAGIDRFLWESYEDEKKFDSYVSGPNVLYSDMTSALSSTTTLAILIVVAIVIVLTGFFLGSAMTSVIMAFSTGVSLISSVALVYSVNYFTPIPFMFVFAMIIAVLVMTFTQSVHIISTYRNELIVSKNDRKKSLYLTVVKCSKTIVAVGICLAAGTLIMALWPVGFISSLGISLLVGVVVSVLVSLFFTVPLIGLTKNELFWTNSSEQTIRWEPMRVFYEKIGKFFAKISYFMAHLSLKHAKAIGVSVLVLGVSCFAAIIIVNPLHNDSNDLLASLTVGESEAGLRVLDEYGYGGIVNPFYVVVEYKQPIAHIEKSTELIPFSEYVLVWDDSVDYDSVVDIADAIRSSDSDNISWLTYFFSWGYYLNQTSGEPQERIDKIIELAKGDNPTAGEVLERKIDWLKIHELFDPSQVINDGPIIDFVVNRDLGLFGYHMIDSAENRVVVSHLNFIVGTDRSSTSLRSIETTHHVSDAVNGYVKDSDSVSRYWMSGVPITYGNIYSDVTGSYVILIVIMLVIMFFVMWGIERDWRYSASIVAVSVVSLGITLALFFGILSLTHGGVYSMFAALVAPIIIFAFNVWYGHISLATVSEQDSLHRARKNLAPLVIVTAITFIFACLPFVFSKVEFISQIGLLFIITLLVDTVLIRILLSPSLWVIYNHYFLQK